MIRLFVAIDLPEDVRDRLASLCTGVPGAKWVPPENLHLTLRFIGEVEETAAHDIAAALSGIAAPRFEIMLGEIGHFGSRGRARVVWAGVERCEPLEHLHDKIESTLVRAGLEPEGRNFTPHITLARLKEVRLSRLRDYLAASNPFAAGPVPVERFLLYSSFLSASGALHRIEAEYGLAPV